MTYDTPVTKTAGSKGPGNEPPWSPLAEFVFSGAQWLLRIVFAPLVWVLAHAVLVRVHIGELNSRWIVGSEVQRPPRAIPVDKPVLVTLEQAKFLYSLGESASEKTDDKVKLLLTLTSSIAALLASLKPQWLSSLYYLPAYAFGACLILATVHFGVRPFFHPEPEPAENEAKSNEEWARCLYDCYTENEKHRQIRVELFAACRRWFLIGMLALMIGALRHSSGSAPPSPNHSSPSNVPSAQIAAPK